MFTRLNRRPHTIVPRDTFSLGTLPFAPINESPRQNPGAGSSGGILYLNRDLGISAIGTASFDYSHETLPIKPRSVVKMDWFSEQLGDKHEHIVLRVSDKVNRKDVWLRFRPYLEDDLGEFAHRREDIVPANTNLRASLAFPNEVPYIDIIKTRHRMHKLLQGRSMEAKHYAYASRFVEMLSATVGRGVGECTSQNLCEIWPVHPSSDRHLRAFYWYINEDSGLEYIVLHVVATLDFKTDQRWWVRLERDKGFDKAFISRSREWIVLRDSELMSQMTFEDGVPFEAVRSILHNMPAGDPTAIDDCWHYTSQLAYELIMNIGIGLGDCPTRDLCRMWSGDRGLGLRVNLAQCYREEGEDAAEYLLVNILELPHSQSRRGLWVRFEHSVTSGTNVDWTSISQNRRRLLSKGSSLIADREFDDLAFSKIQSTISQGLSNISKGGFPLRPTMAEMLPIFSALYGYVEPPRAMTPVITSTMAMEEIIRHLVRNECPNITNQLNLSRCASDSFSRGGFGEVYQGLLHNDTPVALKCIRLSINAQDEKDKKALKNAAHELYAWSQCKHENIVPLLGLVVFRNRLAMVSPWMRYGSLSELGKTSHVVDRYKLCIDVCRGLAYLHGKDIVHGDLKGANILLSDDGSAKITDFGNTVLGSYNLTFTQASSSPHFSSRWTAPEVIDGTVQCSKEADVYALGMTILEIISEQPPYAGVEREQAVIYNITVKKEPPQRPPKIPVGNVQGDKLWYLLNKCWACNPQDRPTSVEVKQIV